MELNTLIADGTYEIYLRHPDGSDLNFGFKLYGRDSVEYETAMHRFRDYDFTGKTSAEKTKLAKCIGLASGVAEFIGDWSDVTLDGKHVTLDTEGALNLFLSVPAFFDQVNLILSNRNLFLEK